MSPLKGSFEKSFVGNSLRESIGLRESVGFRESVANSISPSQPDKASYNQEYQEVVVEENAGESDHQAGLRRVEGFRDALGDHRHRLVAAASVVGPGSASAAAAALRAPRGLPLP